MRDAYVSELLKVHDALAPHGVFKEWCLGAGINYSTAKSIVARSQAAEQQAGRQAEQPAEQPAEQASGTHMHTRPVASTPTTHAPQLVVRLADTEAKADIIARLRDVLAAQGIEKDDWGLALRSLLDFWDEHRRDEAA